MLVRLASQSPKMPLLYVGGILELIAVLVFELFVFLMLWMDLLLHLTASIIVDSVLLSHTDKLLELDEKLLETQFCLALIPGSP